MYFTRVESLIATITAQDLPNEDMAQLVEIIGLENVRKLLLSCPGMSFYVPLKLSTEFHKRYIYENYDKDLNNVRPIARALGITQRSVWRILGEKWSASRTA